MFLGFDRAPAADDGRGPPKPWPLRPATPAARGGPVDHPFRVHGNLPPLGTGGYSPAGIGERTWRRLGGEPADPAHVDAIRHPIALEVALARRRA